MIKGFNEYINEGVTTVTRNPEDGIHQPDRKLPIPNIRQSGRSSAVPHHWNNSPFLSGGPRGAGSNPKDKNTDKKMPKNVKDFKGFEREQQKTKKIEEDQLMTGQNPAAIDPIAEKPITDKIAQLNKQIEQLVNQKNKAEEELNKMRQAKAAEMANAAKAQSGTVQPNQPAPAVNG